MKNLFLAAVIATLSGCAGTPPLHESNHVSNYTTSMIKASPDTPRAHIINPMRRPRFHNRKPNRRPDNFGHANRNHNPGDQHQHVRDGHQNIGHYSNHEEK